MDYTGLITDHHVAVLHDWLTELGELFIQCEYPHSGGSGNGYFVRNLEDIFNVLKKQWHPEIEIFIHKVVLFEIRGSNYPELLNQSLREIPENFYYQIVLPSLPPEEYKILADGKGHDELRNAILKLEPGLNIAIGVHLDDITEEEINMYFGNPIEKLAFIIRKNLNSYRAYADNPEKYRSAIEQWSNLTKGGSKSQIFFRPRSNCFSSIIQ
jgi:hypothetical protein